MNLLRASFGGGALVLIALAAGCASKSAAPAGSTAASSTAASPTVAAGGPGIHLGFHLDPVPGFTAAGVNADRGGEGQQFLNKAAGTNPGNVNIATVELADPSTFAQLPLASKQPITVGGHAAYYAAQRQVIVSHGPGPGPTDEPAATLPVVTWPVTGGDWLLVSPTLYGSATNPDLSAWGRDIRAQLLAIAAAVHTNQTTALPEPFQLTGDASGLTATQAGSDPHSRGPGGNVELTKGSELVSISVNRPVIYSPAQSDATPVRVGAYRGYLDPGCGPQPGPSGAPQSTPSQSDCTLEMRAGPWQVTITAQGPGRDVTSSTMTDLGAHLSLATDPDDSTTWFDAAKVVS